MSLDFIKDSLNRINLLYDSHLEKIILTAKEKNIKVVLAGMYAPTTHGGQFKKEFDKIYPDLAKKHDLTLIPFLLEGVALNPKSS